MDIDTLLHDSQAEGLLDLLGFETKMGRERFLHQLRQITDDPGTLSKRQNAILELRQGGKAQDADLIRQAAHLESEVAGFFDRATLETESYSQLLFSGWDCLKILNTVPFLLFAVSLLKIWLNPIFVLLTPVFAVLGPYLYMRHTWNHPMPFSVYFQILLGQLGIGQPLNLKGMAQVGIAAGSVIQSAYQTVQNSRHLYKIDSEIQRKGAALRSLGACCGALLERLGQKPNLNPLGDLPLDDRMAFAVGWDHPGLIRQALLLIGDFEVVYRIAECRALRRVDVLPPTAGKPALRIREGYDPFLPAETRKSYQVTLGHGILTGPNRGGKSSVLRSILLNVLLAQTVGYSFAGKLQIRLFSWIASGLKLVDTPGKTSMFEREVEFGAQILEKARQGIPGLILFDELFHSTNPPDGKRTANLFLERIWTRRCISSLISTHVFELAEGAPQHVQQLCVPAIRLSDGSLEFTHELTPGICTESSVDLILQEKGFLRLGAASASASADAASASTHAAVSGQKEKDPDSKERHERS